MKIISDFALSLYSSLYRLYGRFILKRRKQHFLFIVSSAYIKANSLFPDATLNENGELARLVTYDFIGVKLPDTDIESTKNKCAELCKSLSSDENIIDALANYFLIESFYFSWDNEDGHNEALKEKADEALAKAKSYKDTASPILSKDIDSINKKVTKKLKLQKKAIQKINSSRIEHEKSKIIKPIKIRVETVFLFLSIFSSLFLFGGFLYNKFLLGYLGINTSDFFDISDYISSSVDIIFPVFVPVLAGMLAYSCGALSRFSEVIAANQFDRKIKNRNGWFYMTVACLILVFAISFIRGEVDLGYFFILIYGGSLYIILNVFNIDKYVENRIVFQFVVMSLLLFLTYLGIYISQTVNEVKNGNYQSPYIVSFEEKYKKYSAHDFFLANSQYVFLLDKETKKIVVIPKTGIKAIRTK